MPSPIGHCLAGLSVAWSLHPLGPIRRLAPRARARLVLACAALPVLPDLDILVGAHRGPSHSLGVALIVAMVAAAVAGRKRLPPSAVTSVALMCGLAYATHLLLDWLGRDSSTPVGLMALWPWSSTFYHSGADVFFDVERRYWLVDRFIFGNMRAIGWEVVVLLPLAGLAWWVGEGRRTTLTR